MPAVVAAAAVGDHVLRHVLDDQILAADAERRLLVELQRAGIPPDDRVARLERVMAGAHRPVAGRFVVRPLQHRVLRLERRTLRAARRAAARRHRRIQRAVQRAEPAAVPRIVAERRNDEQIARARRGDVGQAHAFGLIARDLLGLVLVQLVRRPAADLHRAQPARRVEIAARVVAAHAAGQVGEDHDRELEALGLVHRHQPDAVAALFEDRRLGRFAGRGGPQLVDEAAERDAAAPPRTGAPARRRAARWRAPARRPAGG